MAKVYVSSTQLDLADERRAVMSWLTQADHQPAHSYSAANETVRQGCLNDVRGCDAYVLILGHRYGHVPADDNPRGLSITELEYEAATQVPLPVVVLSAKAIRDVALTDIADPLRYPKVLAFRNRVNGAYRAFEYADEAQLIAGLSTGLAKALGSDPLADPRVQKIITRLTAQNEDKEDEISQLRRRNDELQAQLAAAIARTLDNAAAPGATAQQVVAAEALQRGDTRPSEALLRGEQQAAAQRAAVATDPEAQAAERRRAAALARERGALAVQHDVRAALAAYAQATEHEPDEVWNWFFLGDMQVATGALDAGAGSYRTALQTAQARTARDPGDLRVQRELEVGHERFGDVLVAQGDLAGALQSFRAGLAIAQALAAHDPANEVYQRDLSISHELVGSVLVDQGDLEGALQAFRASMDIRQALAARDPADTGRQRDLAVSHSKIGNALFLQGDLPAALASLREAMRIREALAAIDPANAEWQRGLSVGHENIGNVLVAQGEHDAALLEFRADLAIAAALAARDPANTGWQRDLSISHNRIGELCVTRGDLAGALQAFRAALQIRLDLVARAPDNLTWQRDLSVSHNKIGNLLEKMGDLPAALVSFRADLAIAEILAARDPVNQQWQIDIAISCWKLARLDADAPDHGRALLARGLAALEGLAAGGRLPQRQDWRESFQQRLAEIDAGGAGAASP